MEPSWFFAINSLLHKNHTFSVMQLRSNAVSIYKGLQLDEYMTLSDLRKIGVQIFLWKIERQYFWNHTKSYGRVVSYFMIRNVLELLWTVQTLWTEVVNMIYVM